MPSVIQFALSDGPWNPTSHTSKNWPLTVPASKGSRARAGFLQKREQRLQQQQRLGEASEKVAENILEDLFTTVLDWPLSDFNNQVERADIVLTDHGITGSCPTSKQTEQ